MSQEEQLLDDDGADIFDVMSNRRRRIVTALLSRAGGQLSYGQAARMIAAIELDCPTSAVDGGERKSRYVSLLQNHSEVLEEAGVAKVGREKIFTPTEITESVAGTITDLMSSAEPDVLEEVDRVLEEMGLAPWDLSSPGGNVVYRVPSGDELREMREGAGLTQKRIADDIGVDATSISRYERTGHGLGTSRLRNVVEYIDARR